MNSAALLFVAVEILFTALFLLLRFRFPPIFHKGDVVDWDFDSVSRFRRDFVHPLSRYGNGPFIVVRVWSVDLLRRKAPKNLYRSDGRVTIVDWEGVGHTQFVEVARRKNQHLVSVCKPSGKYFKRVHHAHKKAHHSTGGTRSAKR